MERSNVSSTKRKIKKEPLPLCSNESNMKKPTVCRELEETNGPLSNKDYACISPETVTIIAESIGLPNVGDDIASNLAEDVSYKLQELINVSCTIMRKSKRRKLLPSDINSALRISDVHHIFGHSRKDPYKFLKLSEGEIFIAADSEVDLSSVAFNSSIPKLKRPSYITTSYPVLHGTLGPSMNGHNVKTEDKYFAIPHSKSVVVNGDMRSESLSSYSNFYNDNSSRRVNGPTKLSQLYGVKAKLKRDSEEELKFSKAQLTFFSVIAKCIVEGHNSLFQQALFNLRRSRKIDIIAAPLLNFISLTVCHVPRHFVLLSRLLETVDVLLCNVNISPTFSIAVNRLVNALLAITADQNVLQGQNDFLLRRRAAQLLSKVLLVWGIEEQHVSELLSRIARVLGDSKENILSHYGALVIFQSLGRAALGWLYPLLKCFLPILERRFPLYTSTSSLPKEEIRGVLLDIAELLCCDVNSHQFKIKASTIQERQAKIQLDTLLYHYCGDAICARRRPSVLKFCQARKMCNHFEKSHKVHIDSRARQQISNCAGVRYISHFPQKLKKRIELLEVFEESRVTPITKRKDIQFRFAGANPVPKDGLRKKVLDKTHVLFKSLSNSKMHSIFPRQHLIVSRMHVSQTKPSTAIPYSLLNVL